MILQITRRIRRWSSPSIKRCGMRRKLRKGPRTLGPKNFHASEVMARHGIAHGVIKIRLPRFERGSQSGFIFLVATAA